MKHEPELGDKIIVVWADICEVMDCKPDEHMPRVYEAKGGTFLGWHTMSVQHGDVKCDLEYLLVATGDKDVITGDERSLVAYPKGCVLGIRVGRKPRRKGDSNGQVQN